MHQCSVCPKSFPSPYKLKRHYLTHTGQKPFNCEICAKAFTQSEHLKTHLQNVHHSRLPTDRLQSGVLTHQQQPNCDRPAAGITTHGCSNYTSMLPTVSASATSQTERKGEIVSHKICVPSSETGKPPKNVPYVNDGSMTEDRSSNLVDPIPSEQVDSANVGTSVRNAHDGYTCKVCLKSFPSSLHLRIHSPTHNRPKQFERGRELGQTFSKKACSKAHQQSQELSSITSKITLQHQCPKCLKTFCSPSKLKRHFLIHTGQKPYSCIVCWKAFRQKVHLKSHLSTANKCSLSAGTERKKLRFCDSRQTSTVPPQSSLQQRSTNHHNPVSSAVELELRCKISVNAVQDLNKTEIRPDVTVKSEPLLNTDSRCQSFCHKSDEQEQQHRTHKDLKPFQCVICNRSFRLEVNLIRHHKIHSNQKELGSPTAVRHSNDVKMSANAIKPEPSHANPIDLNIIAKSDTWSDNCSDHNDSLLQDSELMTSEEQQRETYHATRKQQRINTLHQCHTCLKCFPSVSKLQRHILTHTGQRPFGCEVCGKRFRQKTHLRVHCRTHLWSRYHKQRSLYINRPPSCVGGFNARTAADVPVQEMLMHKKDFERQTGSDVVDEPHALKENEAHLRKFSKVTVIRTQTAKSMQNPGHAQHKCSRCLKCFPSASKLQRHEMVHTGLKPFQCALCGKAFRQAPHLKTHERTHCEKKPSKAVNQPWNIRKLKVNSQQQLNPRISVRILPKKKSVNTNTTLSNFDGAVCNGVSETLCTGREICITKVNSLCKSKVTCKKRKFHTCRICFKNFLSPYKLSRHLVTHSGIRPYKCTLCSKTFTQRGHLKIHEYKCRQSNRMSHYIQGEMVNPNHLQVKCIENLTDCTDFSVGATTEQPESHYTSVCHYPFTDGDLSYFSEARDTEWLAVPEVGLQEESNESEEKQREKCNEALDNYDQATDHHSYSFPSELTLEINKLVQNQNMAALPLSHHHEGKAHNVVLPCQPKGVTAVSDRSRLLSEKCVSSVVENQMQTDKYWCEPLIVFECDKCPASFTSGNDLKLHICSTEVQPKTTQNNRCDICFKDFVSPSKLKRHYFIHTGQRPFRCDICGKTFTQSAHVRTHQLTH